MSTRQMIMPLLLLVLSLNTFADPANPTDAAAVNIVENTASNIETDMPKTLKKINQGDIEYWPRKDKLFFVFVLNENIQIIACPILRYYGKNYEWIKDEEGKFFRKNTVAQALKDEKGWLTFTIRSKGALKKKKTFFKLVKGSDDKNYIVCCDIDFKEAEGE